MASKLQTKIYKSDDVIEHNIPKHLPNPTRLKLLIVAPSYSGKTNLLNNFIENESFGYKDFYGKNIFLFSPTSNIDKIYKDDIEKGLIDASNVFTHFDWSVINDIKNDQIKLMDAAENGYIKKIPNVLIIIDDFASYLKGVNQRNLINAFQTFRHYRISFIITSQTYTNIPKPLRDNASCLIFFPNRINESNKEDIYREQSLDRKDFDNIWNIVKNDGSGYSFLYINNEEHDVNKRYYLNFTDKLTITDNNSK